MMKFNQYKYTAEFYDNDFKGTDFNDIDFYLSLIKNKYSDVLELCCGTGRISLPLVNNGISLTGVDLSKDMLQVFRQKMLDLDSVISKKITLIEANMTDFVLSKTFDCVLIPYHSFQVLISESDIEQTLNNIYRHMSDNGVVILNIFKPLSDMKKLEGLSEEKDVLNNDGIVIYRKHCINTAVDTDNHILEYEYSYTPVKYLKPLFQERFKLKYYSEAELTHLLYKHQFSVINRYDGFRADGTCKFATSELTLVCKKTV